MYTIAFLEVGLPLSMKACWMSALFKGHLKTFLMWQHKDVPRSTVSPHSVMQIQLKLWACLQIIYTQQAHELKWEQRLNNIPFTSASEWHQAWRPFLDFYCIMMIINQKDRSEIMKQMGNKNDLLKLGLTWLTLIFYWKQTQS